MDSIDPMRFFDEITRAIGVTKEELMREVDAKKPKFLSPGAPRHWQKREGGRTKRERERVCVCGLRMEGEREGFTL